ncbi:MAG TPA: aldo/keto reductase [Solirubrobacterales bacterium]|nr:aldo/keto reductase [Solirubrobacterales bacterium]
MQTTFNTSIGPALEFLYGKRANVRLGFGCASLMRLPSRRRRQALLAEAFEQGIRHFDVARMYGLGAAEGELGRFAALLLSTGWPQCVPQLHNDIFSFGAPQTSGKVPPIYFGVFAEALSRIRARLLADEELRATWQQETGLDCADSKVLARLLLQDALDRNRAGGVIFATTRPQRIGEAVAAASVRRGPNVPAPLDTFRRLVAGVDWRAGGA